MALGKNRRRINVKGGGTVLIRELDPAPTDGFSDLGIIEALEVNDDNQMIDIPDAEGNMLEYLSGLRRVGVKITLMQSSYDEISFLTTAGNKYFDMLYSVYLEGLGVTQSWSFCLLKLKPGGVYNFAGATKRSIVVDCVALAPKAAFTRTPTSINIVAWKPFIIYENATPLVTPTDTAATMAAAII